MFSFTCYLPDKASTSRYKYSDKFVQRLHYSLYGGVYLIFILIKNKAFQSEVLQKMHP